MRACCTLPRASGALVRISIAATRKCRLRKTAAFCSQCSSLVWCGCISDSNARRERTATSATKQTKTCGFFFVRFYPMFILRSWINRLFSQTADGGFLPRKQKNFTESQSGAARLAWRGLAPRRGRASGARRARWKALPEAHILQSTCAACASALRLLFAAISFLRPLCPSPAQWQPRF